MTAAKPLPDLWLLSDARNEPALEPVLRSFAVPLGFVFRHYFLPPRQRHARFCQLARIARAQGHLVVLAGSSRLAKEWGADGAYGAPATLGQRRTGLLTITTAHNLAEIAAANRACADAVMLSPVFPTRSHPGAAGLGVMPFLMLAKRAAMPVIALGGMDRHRALHLGWPRWAAIDGLSASRSCPNY